MSDQPKEAAPKKRAVRSREPAARPGAEISARAEEKAVPDSAAPRMDPAASAALALAVTSAQRTTVTRRPGTHSALNANQNAPARTWIAAALAAGAVLGLGTGWAVGQASAVPTTSAPQPWAETTQALRQSQDDVVRLTGDVKALKVAVETLKDGFDRGRADDAARQAQLVDRLGRAAQEGAAQSASLSERLDRIEALAKDPAARIAGLGERLERIETEVTAVKAATAPAAAVAPAALSVPAPAQPQAPAPAPAAAAEAPSQTGSVPKDAAVEGWVLHEVYDGVALIEGRNRRLVEVGPGEIVPGIGRVEAIERRGKRWVVITPKGVISMVR